MSGSVVVAGGPGDGAARFVCLLHGLESCGLRRDCECRRPAEAETVFSTVPLVSTFLADRRGSTKSLPLLRPDIDVHVK